MNPTSTLGLVIVAGTASAQMDLAPERVGAHLETRSIYITMSGERIEVDATHQVLGTGDRTRVWVNNRSDPCGLGRDPDGPDDIPGTEDDRPELYIWRHAVNDPDSGTFRTPDMVLFWWGDVPANSRVNSVATWVWHDLQGPVEGGNVPGFSMTIGFVDRVSGAFYGFEDPRLALNVTIPDLPDAADDLLPGMYSGVYLALDLGDPDPRLDATFELGDDDGIGPGSGYFTPFGYYDHFDEACAGLDGAGLHDFGYYTTFGFPKIGNEGASTAFFGAYGDVEYAPTGGDFFSFLESEVNGLASGLLNDVEVNTFVAFDSGLNPETGLPLGINTNEDGRVGYFRNGFIRCDDEHPNEPIIHWLEMYFAEPVEVCVADFDGSGEVNILDILAFIEAWNGGLDYDGSGSADILDVVRFIEDWNGAVGC